MMLHPTMTELRDIEKEMQLQETLIKGYQRENERLVQEAEGSQSPVRRYSAEDV